MKKLLTLLLILLTSGCASSLETYNHEWVASPGVPIYTPILVEVTTETTYKVDPKHNEYASYCTPDEKSTIEFFPLGEVYFLNFNSSTFGKSEFAITFSDKGVLTSVTLNSDPKIAENVEQISGLLGTVLPFLSAPKETEAAEFVMTDPETVAAQKIKETYCIKSSTKVKSLTRRNVE